MERDKKICPYCGEEIMAGAKKCRFCGEWFESTSPVASPVTQAPQPAVATQESAPSHDSAPVFNSPAAPSPAPSPVYAVPVAAPSPQPMVEETVFPVADDSEVPESDDKKPSFFDAYLVQPFIRQYADFKGTTSRKDYWLSTLAYLIVYMGLFFGLLGIGMKLLTGGSMVGAIICGIILVLLLLAVVVPGYALPCRRLRDTGKNPWLMLLILIPYVGAIAFLVLMLLPSKEEHKSTSAKMRVSDYLIITVCMISLVAGGWMYVSSSMDIFNSGSRSSRVDEMIYYDTDDEDWTDEESVEVVDSWDDDE